MRKLAMLTGLALALAGCGGGDEEVGQSGPLTIYSGREEEIIAPLLQRFEEESGVDVEVRYGDSAELAATISEEGENSPADVFFAQDPGSLGSLERDGLLAELPEELLARIDPRFRDPDSHWVGTSGRVRVVAFNTETLDESDLPDSILDFADPRWKGKLGLAPTNASFQAFVTAMRLSLGAVRTREWLEAIKANEPRFYPKNLPIVEAIGRGEIEVGLVNHYYLFLAKEENPDLPVANHYLEAGDPGALVSVAGVAMLKESDAAEQFVEFLLSDEGQRFYAEEAEEAEYPLVDGIPPREGLPPLAELEGPDIRLDALGGELEETLELLNELGYTR